jgi:hypothetical protein
VTLQEFEDASGTCEEDNVVTQIGEFVESGIARDKPSNPDRCVHAPGVGRAQDFTAISLNVMNGTEPEKCQALAGVPVPRSLFILRRDSRLSARFRGSTITAPKRYAHAISLRSERT